MSNDLKEILKEKTLTLGTERTIKMIKQGKVKEIFMASNCPETTKKEIKYLAKIGNIKVVELKEANDEIGVICKKPFSIAVLCY